MNVITLKCSDYLLLIRSVPDLELISRVAFGAPSTNNFIPPLPFREVKLASKLKFGYYTSGWYFTVFKLYIFRLT